MTLRRPLYLQAIDDLKAYLEDGNYQVGQALPSVDELASQLGISRPTMREALAYLEQQGRVVRQQGVGTFVTRAAGTHLIYSLERLTSFRSLAEATGRDFQTIGREISVIEPDAEQSALFKLEPGARLVRVQWVAGFDGAPVAYIDSLLPAQRIDLEALQRTDDSLLEFLVESNRPAPRYTLSHVWAVNADRAVATRLAVAVGTAILFMREVCYSTEGSLMAVFNSHVLTDSFNYTIVRHIDHGFARRTH